jgi:hypothetical protein
MHSYVLETSFFTLFHCIFTCSTCIAGCTFSSFAGLVYCPGFRNRGRPTQPRAQKLDKNVFLDSFFPKFVKIGPGVVPKMGFRTDSGIFVQFWPRGRSGSSRTRPANSGRELPGFLGSSRDYREVPEDSREVPQDSREVPQDSREVPRDSREVPRDSREVSQYSWEVPRDSREVPQDSREVPWDSREVPRDFREAPWDSRELFFIFQSKMP